MRFPSRFLSLKLVEIRNPIGRVDPSLLVVFCLISTLFSLDVAAAPAKKASGKSAKKAAVTSAPARPTAVSAPTTKTASPASRAITHGDRQSPMIALTFDDAPHPQYVPRLLALFRAEEIRVTFFLVGDALKLYPDVARAIVADGHEIGNHSLTHENLGRASATSLVEGEIVGMQRLIKETLGVTPAVYRPPFGNLSAEVKRICDGEKLAIVTWDVDTNDWRQGTTRETIVRNVLNNVSSGSIILMHATHLKTVEAVAELIPILRFRKLQMVTLSELLHERSVREEQRRLEPKQGPVTLKLRDSKENGRTSTIVPTAPSTYSIQMPVLPLP